MCTIVNSCADCQGHTTPLQMGVDPSGLRALQVWQTDVAHLRIWMLKVCVSVDTFSLALRDSVHTGERSRDAIADWHSAFAALGIPHAKKPQ